MRRKGKRPARDPMERARRRVRGTYLRRTDLKNYRLSVRLKPELGRLIEDYATKNQIKVTKVVEMALELFRHKALRKQKSEGTHGRKS